MSTIKGFIAQELINSQLVQSQTYEFEPLFFKRNVTGRGRLNKRWLWGGHHINWILFNKEIS